MSRYGNQSSTSIPERTRVIRAGGFVGMTLFMLLALCPYASAQVTGGTMSGSVTDPSGAAVPGASVSILNRAKGETRTATSSDTGFYSVPNLTPGNYDVTVSLAGFKTAVKSNLVLEVGQELVANIQLNVGDVSEKVTITEEPITVNTTTCRSMVATGHFWRHWSPAFIRSKPNRQSRPAGTPAPIAVLGRS